MRVISTSIFILVCLLAAPANAGPGSITELHLVSAGGKKHVVAVSDTGITFIDAKAGKPFRSWKSKPVNVKGTFQDYFQLVDVDRNGTIDAVVSGKPAFIVAGDGAPVHAIARGCAQFNIGDYAADKSLDILCRNGNTLTVTTHDGQKLWEYKVQGLNLGVCRFGDINGDLKTDIECEVKGRDQFVRVGGDGTEIGRELETAALSDPDDDNPAAGLKNYLSGNETFDLDGDGTAEESILQDGKAIVVRSKAKKAGIARHDLGTITAVLVDDVDEDGKMEVVLGGDGKVFIIDDKGKLAHTVTANPTRLRRKSDVRIERLDANGLADSSDKAVRAVLEKLEGKVNACYATNVKRDPYTRVGRTIWSLNVSDKGSVSKVERLHSDLADKRVEDCLSRALKGARFSKATSPGATVTVTLNMGFVDG